MAFRKVDKAVVRLAASWSYQEPSPHAIPTQARRIFTHPPPLPAAQPDHLGRAAQAGGLRVGV